MIYNAHELPLFSKRDDPNIYRPISVISVPFERIVYDQLYSHLEVHDNLNISRVLVEFIQL